MCLEESFRRVLEDAGREVPYEVLFLEDDVKKAKKLADLYDKDPIRFQIAPTSDEADRVLNDSRPDLVIADVMLGDQSITGDVWLAERMDRLRDVRKVVLTGYMARIEDPQWLRQQGVEIISKGEPEEDMLWEHLPSVALTKPAIAIRKMTDEIVEKGSNMDMADREKIGNTTGIDGQDVDSRDVVHDSVLRLFQTWAMKLPADIPSVLFVGSRSLSANDMIREVNQRTEIGRWILDLFVEDLNEMLG